MDSTRAFDLTGLVDLHVHASPDAVPRCVDDVEAARAAGKAGMRALMLKSHLTCTADRAEIAERVVHGEVRVLGGLALNYAVGGLNPAAVEAALALGARQVWMPTRDAARSGSPRDGLSILDLEGQVRAEVHALLELVAEADGILGSGHLPLHETAILARLAWQKGVRKVLITHPASGSVLMPLDLQLELAAGGAFLERCYLPLVLRASEWSVAALAAEIRAVGVASTVLSTDLGRAGLPTPVDGFAAYLAQLAAEGFSTAELRRMAGQNPAALLDL